MPRWLTFAAFLASSWTWCIGMFLPLLLVRDLGWLGFIIFAVPNCFGAAAMGTVLRDASASAALVNRHRPAIRLFSLVTIAFHAFFLAWLFADPATSAAANTTSLLAVSVVFAVLVAMLSAVAQGVLALVLWLAVLAVTVLWISAPATYLASPPPAADSAQIIPAAPQLPIVDALFLAPVCLFGFALCPYLDATFHRARQSLAPAAGRTAFALGFLALFPLFITFTILYAGVFLWGRHITRELVCWHIALQAGYTVGVHAHALANLSIRRPVESARTPLRGVFSVSSPTAIFTIVALFWLLTIIIQQTLSPQLAATPPARVTPAQTLGVGESIYRLFMGAYGLVFPAYVYLVIIPRRAPASGGANVSPVVAAAPEMTTLRRSRLILTAAAVTLAAPLFYLGFVERQSLYLAPGLALVLLARLALRPSPSG